jgi:hypothetical protein
MSVVTANISLTGQQTIQQLNAVLPSAIDRALESIFRTIKPKIQASSPVGIRYVPIKRKASGERRKGVSGTGHYVQSGDLVRSWVFSRTSDSITASTAIPYADILERGAFPGVGKARTGLMGGHKVSVSPRTVSNNGGIFSSRASEGILSPIVSDQAWLNSVTQTVVREIFRSLQQAGANP